MKEILSNFYGGRDEVIKHFGSDDPSFTKRVNYFMKLWNDFGETSEVILSNLSNEDLLNYRIKLGPFNMLVRGKRARFRYMDDAVFMKLINSK